MSIEDLEGKVGIMQILIYLHKQNAPMNISDLHRNIKAARDTIITDIKRLKILGLVEDEENQKVFPFSHSVWLTGKGHAVAEQLEAVSRALGHLQPAKEY